MSMRTLDDGRTLEDLRHELQNAESKLELMRTERDRYRKRAEVLLDLLHESRSGRPITFGEVAVNLSLADGKAIEEISKAVGDEIMRSAVGRSESRPR